MVSAVKHLHIFPASVGVELAKYGYFSKIASAIS